MGPRGKGIATLDRPLAYQAMGALECVVFGSAEVALVRCQKANLGEVWRELFEGDSLLLRDAGDHDRHVWWRDAGEDFREPLCGNQNFTARSESSRRPPRHRRAACSMAWRCRFLTAPRSQHGSVIAEK